MNTDIIDELCSRSFPTGGDGAPICLKPNQVEEIFGRQEITLTVPTVPLVGHMTYCELGLIVGIARALGCQNFFEIGTFDGMTTRNILDNCENLSSVVTVDLPQDMHLKAGAGLRFVIDSPNASLFGKVDIGHRFRGHPRQDIVRQIFKDSALLSASDLPCKPDCCFVDGCHTYDYCRSDTLFCIDVIQRPGVIFIHDYAKLNSLPGVSCFVTELVSGGNYPVFRLGSGDLLTSLVVAVIP